MLLELSLSNPCCILVVHAHSICIFGPKGGLWPDNSHLCFVYSSKVSAISYFPLFTLSFSSHP